MVQKESAAERIVFAAIKEVDSAVPTSFCQIAAIPRLDVLTASRKEQRRGPATRSYSMWDIRVTGTDAGAVLCSAICLLNILFRGLTPRDGKSLGEASSKRKAFGACRTLHVAWLQ